MATTVAKLNIHLGADAGSVTTAFNTAGSTVSKFAGHVNNLTASLKNLLAAYLGFETVKSIAGVASDAESAAVSFRVLLGDAESAKEMIASIRSFAAMSPQENVTLRDAARLLLNYGVAASDIMPTLEMLTAVAGDDANKLNALALAFGQVSAAGKLTGSDLLQMVNASFNPLQVLAEGSTEKYKELRKVMEEGNFTLDMVREAFRKATAEGGRFFGMTDEMSKTLSGRFSTLKDSVTELAVQIGERLMPAMKATVEAGISLVDWFRNLDAFTVKQTLKIIGMTAALVATIRVIPMLVSGIKTIVDMYRAWATAQATLSALQGAKGIALLFAGLSAAALAGVAIDQQFDNLTKTMEETQVQSQSTVDSINDISNSMDSLRQESAQTMASLEQGGQSIAGSVSNAAKTAASEIERTKEKYREMEQALKGQGTTAAVDRFSSEGFQAIFGSREQSRVQDEIRKLREEERKHVERLERGNREIVKAVKDNALRNNEVNL